MICTFYSFKGGVGRSMALANIAELFYGRGLKVLMIDFDLEAPGLERYFPLPVEKVAAVQSQRGIVDMVLSFQELQSYGDENGAPAGREAPFSVEPLGNFVFTIRNEPEHPGKLELIPCGDRKDPDFAEYAKRVLSIDWTDFYIRRGGERFFDWFRRELLKVPPEGWDIVLIDSRTGVTEVGGVCTHHLPDLVVNFVATNAQNPPRGPSRSPGIPNWAPTILRPHCWFTPSPPPGRRRRSIGKCWSCSLPPSKTECPLLGDGLHSVIFNRANEG